MTRLSQGALAPGFALRDTKGDIVSLDDELHAGPIVLIFYPMDSTPGCAAQLCAVRDDSARYDDAGVRVFGVNNGNSDSHWRFAAQHRLQMKLLIDGDLKVSRAYGATHGPLPMIRRTVVGIGADGRIAFYERGAPSTDTILAGLGLT